MPYLPSLNDQDSARLRRLLADDLLFPIMNDTKWSELIDEMLATPDGVRPQFRTRSVFAPEGFVTEWDGEWYYHIHPVAELEWVEIRAESDDWLLSVLRSHNIPFSIENGVYRVWGYTRPGRQPDWES